MRIANAWILIFGMWWIGGRFSGAQEAGLAGVTLQKAREMAFARNWDLLAAKVDVDLATAAKVMAKEYPNPSVSLSTTKIDADGHGSAPGPRNDVWSRSYDTIAAVNQLIEVGGKRKWRQASAAANYDFARERLRDAKRLLDLAVTRAFVAALLAEENTRSLRQSAGSLRKEAEIANTRQRAGDISLSDKSQIEITAERFELDASSAEASARMARIALETLLGEPRPTGQTSLSGSLETLAEERVPLIDTNQPPLRSDLLATEAAARKAEADLRLQKALRLPDPTLFAQYEHEPPSQPNTIGFGISIPVPLWNHNRGGIMAAKASAEQASVLVSKLKAQIGSEIAAAQVTYQTSYSRWEKYRAQISPRSAELRGTVAFAYEKGGASLLDLLSAERNDNEVRLATLQAAADTANAIAVLQSAMNKPELDASYEIKK